MRAEARLSVLTEKMKDEVTTSIVMNAKACRNFFRS